MSIFVQSSTQPKRKPWYRKDEGHVLKYDDINLTCPMLPREIDTITAKYDYQGSQSKTTKYCPQDLYENKSVIQSVTLMSETFESIFVLSSEDLIGYKNIQLTSIHPLGTVKIQMCTPHGNYTFWTTQCDGCECLMDTNGPIAFPFRARVDGDDATSENQLHISVETKCPVTIHYDKVILNQDVVADLKKFRMIIYRINPLLWVTFDRQWILTEYDLTTRIFRAHIAPNNAMRFVENKSCRVCTYKDPSDIDKEYRYEWLKQREHKLQLTNVIQVNAIQQYKTGWYIHKSHVDLQDVVDKLNSTYPEHKYTVDSGRFIQENGIDVACMYERQEESKKSKECWTTSYGIGSMRDDDLNSVGIGIECDGKHTMEYIPLQYPFYMFTGDSFDFKFLMSDGKHLELEKKDGTYIVKVDGEIISSKYQPNNWELFRLKYPGEYKSIGLTEAYGINSSTIRQQFLEDDGTSYVYWDGMILQSFPSQIVLKVESKNYQRALKRIREIISRYKRNRLFNCKRLCRIISNSWCRCRRRQFSMSYDIEEWEDVGF